MYEKLNPGFDPLQVKTLNRFEIRPKKFIGVVLSVDNRKLWVNGLPRDKSASEIKVGWPRFDFPIGPVSRLLRSGSFLSLQVNSSYLGLAQPADMVDTHLDRPEVRV